MYADETELEPALPLTVGIGMDAGEAVPVEGGFRGAALNLGARLNKRARPGEVLVSQGIVHLVGKVQDIRLELHEEAEVKGISEPVKVFRVVTDRPETNALSRTRHELPAALAVAAPMIGRDPELRRLLWAWRIARRGSGSVKAIVGPTGIGKTRLLAELAASVTRGGGRVTYWSFAATRAGWPEGSNPGLLVLDDLDLATPGEIAEVEEVIAPYVGNPVLVCIALDDTRASNGLITTVHRLAPDSDSITRLQPLDLEQMLELASLYLGGAVGAIPRDVLTLTGGVPRRVHEEVGRWAYQHASRRLGKLASQAATGRTELRSVEANLADTVVDLQVVRDQRRLFGLTPGRVQTEAARSPYLGLASFQLDDAEIFFGRERLVAEMIARLAGARLLGVVGPSGSGKSSAVRAGLVPALAAGALPGSERWTVVLLRPGDQPLRALDRALWTALPKPIVERLGNTDRPLADLRHALGEDERVVVVIDQFEETFTACLDEAEQARFLTAIEEAARESAGRVIPVLVIRADFYGRCAADPELADLLGSNHVLVGPMSAEEYRRVIVQPASRVGVDVEPELVDDLVADVFGEAGALPLLSTTLLELWNRVDGRTMRRQEYLASGGLHGAVARLADSVYEGLQENERSVARRIFLRLAGPGGADLAVRRRVALSEFDAGRDQTVAAVLDSLTAGRLLTVSDGFVEVAHEALLREWPRLQEWLEEDREGRRLHAHLMASAQEWARRQRDPAELYRGARLSAAMDWTTEHNLELNELEREFVNSSRVATQRELVRHKQQNRRLRGLLAGASALLIAALVAGSVAFVQRQAADSAARQALGRQLGAEALSTPRIDQAMLLARESVLLDRSPQTESTLLATLLRSPALLGTFTTPLGVRPLWPAVSPDGKTLAVADNAGEVLFFDTETYRQTFSALEDHSGLGPGTMLYAGPYFFAPHLPPGDNPGWFDVFDAATMHLVRSMEISYKFDHFRTGVFNPLVASADGQHLYFSWALAPPDGSDGAAYIDAYDVASGSLTEVAVGSNGLNGAGTLSGNRLMVVTDTAAVTLDGTTLKILSSVPMHLPPGLVAISPDGDRLVSAPFAPDPASTRFSLVDLKTGDVVPAGGSHASPINDLLFTPDGRLVVSVGTDYVAKVWSAANGALVETLTGHSGSLTGMAISADSRTLYTSGLDSAVFQWDLAGDRSFGRLFNVASGGPFPTRDLPAILALSPDGSRFAARTAPGQIGIFSVRTLKEEQGFSITTGDIFSAAWSRNQTLAIGETGNVELWNVQNTPALRQTLSGLPGSVRAVAISPDSASVAAVTAVPRQSPVQQPDGWLGVWDASSGRSAFKQDVSTNGLSVAIEPRGRFLAAGLDDGRVLIVDMTSGASLKTLLPLGGSPQAVAFRSDGTLLTGSWAGAVQRWVPLTGHQLGHPILAEQSPVSSLSGAPDQGTFATAGSEIKLWDSGSLQQFGSDLQVGGGWSSVTYTPDGSNVLVIENNGTGGLWPVSPQAWTEHACAVAHRNFTHEEWSRFVPGYAYQQVCPEYPPGP